jgi:signal transduction histidine kinase
MKNPDWFLDRIQSDDRERIINLLGLAFKASNLPFSSECRMRHKNGHTVHTILKITPDSEGDEDQLGVKTLAGIIVDITDRVFSEQTLVQKEKLKTLGAISAEVAHVIRNPLVSIGGFARRLKHKFPKLPEGNIILQESERLEGILYRIMEYLKPVEVSYQTCSINEVLKDCVALLLPEMKHLNIACRMEPDPSLSAVPGDKDLLSQIFAALIQNAMREMKAGGTLLIRTFESEENIHVEFRNQNLRSKARDTECYFMPFDKGDQKMGLPYSIRVLKNMGGLLSVSQDQNDMVFEVSHPKKVLSIPEIDGLTEMSADLFMPVSDDSPVARG